jgi:hypothetical protein
MKLKSLILGVAAGMIFSVTASFGQTTIVLTLMNPSFESPTVGSGGYTFSTPNWGGPSLSYGNAEDAIINPTTPYSLQTGSNVGQIYANGGGAGLFFIQSPGNSFVAGDTYTYTLDCNNQGGDTAYLNIDISGGTILAQTLIPQTSGNGMITASVSYLATGLETGPVEVSIKASMSGSDSIQIDNALLTQFDPTPVPEPSTMALAAMGGIGLLTLIRSRWAGYLLLSKTPARQSRRFLFLKPAAA